MKNGVRILIIATTVFMHFFAFNTFGKNAELETGSISGIIVSENSGPVSFASVALLNASDSSLITGVITDNDGKFKFNSLAYGKFNIKASYIGYKTIQIKNIEVSRQNRTIELNEIKMAEDVQNIDAALVVGQRLKGEEKIDRTVFTLNDDVRKASTTALDALKHIPSVTVDFQNNVTLEGQSNIQFYVDGVLRNKDYVAQIKPDMIDKIELITNPGAKYDADVSGVINIVLKKEARYGMSGSLQVPLPHPDKIVAEPNGNFEYGNRNFRFYIGDRMHFERFNGAEIINTKIDDVNGQPYRFEKRGEGINSWQNNYMNYGVDWFLNDKSSLNFLGEWRNWKGVSDDYLSNSSIFTGDQLTQMLRTKINTLDKSDNYYFSLYFQRKLTKEGDEFKAEIYYNTQAGRAKNDYSEVYLAPEDMISPIGNIDRIDLTENMRKNGELKLDLSFSIKNLRNEVGLRSYAGVMNNDFTKTYSIEGVSNKEKEEFKYIETRQTAYYNLSGKIQKLTWQVGLRGEYTRLDINSNSKSDYFTLLPQFSLNQSLEKGQNIKFTYRKQIFRPSVNSLNPFETWTDSLHVRIGNPNLEPSVENRFELSYSKNFKSNYISPKIYFRYTENGIQDNTQIVGEGVTYITQDNVGKNMEYGISLNGAFQILKRWRFNANVSVYDQLIRTEESIAGHSKEEIVAYRFNFSNIITLPKDYTLFFQADYGSRSISYQREFTRDLLPILGAEKKFSEKFKVDVFYAPFIGDFVYERIKTYTPGYYESWKGVVEVKNLFCFNITYSFNRGNKIGKINRNVEYERNEGSGGL